MKAARRRWKDRIRHWNLRDLLPRLVFFDEAGAKTNMTRLRGRSLQGKRCHDTTPHGHWHTTTMLASVRLDGTTTSMTISGATTGEVFCAYAEHILAPSLRPGDILVLDNLSSHHNKAALAHIAKAGARVVFLPPYSPDFNPIEKMWSKIKALLRAAKARTEEALFNAIASSLKAVTAQDVRGWFASCGYKTLLTTTA